MVFFLCAAKAVSRTTSGSPAFIFRMMDMQKLLLFVDKISTWVGHAFAWLILVLTLQVSWEVFSRYALNKPNAWAFDLMIMMYGTVFMMAGAYTLAKNGHVRGDVLYGFFPPRLQAGLDLALYILFFIPGTVALVWAGYTYASESWAINEHSTLTASGPPLYPFKTIIPIAGIFLLAQGLVEMMRCVVCLRQGEWPAREQDVEEVDVDKLKEMVDVKDEDIAALSTLATENNRGQR
jgi:TRAP-type mannitol/chloroaromatic compound transport system permease small subunit